MAAASLPDGRAVVVGGENPGGDLTTAHNLRPGDRNLQLCRAREMSASRKVLAAAPVLSTGQVLVVGGYTYPPASR